MSSRIVRARLDEVSERALHTLMHEGRNESEAVRTALTEAGRKRSQRSTLSEEVQRLATDADDVRARRSARADMDANGTDWPE